MADRNEGHIERKALGPSRGNPFKTTRTADSSEVSTSTQLVAIPCPEVQLMIP